MPRFPATPGSFGDPILRSTELGPLILNDWIMIPSLIHSPGMYIPFKTEGSCTNTHYYLESTIGDTN